MTAAEVMTAIQGARFSAIVNVASNLKTFLRGATAQPEMEELSRLMANNPALVAQVVQQAMQLVAAPITGDTEHPADAALAAYLLLLGNHPNEFAQVAAAILKQQDQFFWACKVAQESMPESGMMNGTSKAVKGQTAAVVAEQT